MVDTESLLQRLILSATDLKYLTAQQRPGDPWPDALVEDYLNILRDLVTLADIIDANAQDTIFQILRLSQESAVNRSAIAKNRSNIVKLDNKGNNLEQLVHAW